MMQKPIRHVPSNGPTDFTDSWKVVVLLIVVFVILFFWSKWDSKRKRS
jgi:hypothetical protein